MAQNSQAMVRLSKKILHISILTALMAFIFLGFKQMVESEYVQTIYYLEYALPDIYADRKLDFKIFQKQFSLVARVMEITIDPKIPPPSIYVIPRRNINYFMKMRGKRLEGTYFRNKIFIFSDDYKSAIKTITHELCFYFADKYMSGKDVERVLSNRIENDLHPKNWKDMFRDPKQNKEYEI